MVPLPLQREIEGGREGRRKGEEEEEVEHVKQQHLTTSKDKGILIKNHYQATTFASPHTHAQHKTMQSSLTGHYFNKLIMTVSRSNAAHTRIYTHLFVVLESSREERTPPSLQNV